jgi:predicted dehydrogenase
MAGGGALLDMGCHTIEAARYFFGKDVPMTEAFAWGATLSHQDKTTGEDNAVALIKFANGGISVTEASWSMKGGMELRNEVTGTDGRLVTDSTATPVHGFITNPAGYLMEKADADTGWVYPIPDEARAYGYMEEMRHFVECFRDGTEPRETFVDGYVVNAALDACYRSMQSGRWEPIELDPEIA